MSSGSAIQCVAEGNIAPIAPVPRRARWAAGWTTGGFLISQCIRVVSTMALSRLLAPDDYGVMAIVGLVLYGMEMISDTGAGSTVVFAKREDARFLNTIWTVQALRGLGLSIAVAALAWPVARFYDQPVLFPLLLVAACAPLMNGLVSTRLHSAKRHLLVDRLAIIEVTAQAMGIGASIMWAWVHPGPWSLLGGMLLGASFRTLLTHTYLPGLRNRWDWDRAAIGSLTGFGKWIFFSSILFFLASQADRALLSHYLSLTILGLYSIAGNLAEVVPALNMRVSRAVMLPVLSRLHRDEPRAVGAAFYRMRLPLDWAFLGGIGVLAAMAPLVVAVLYDKRYVEAGWILQLLCLRAALRCVAEPCEQCLVGIGRPDRAVLANAARAAWIVGGVVLGWWLWGLWGLVLAVALSEAPIVGVYWVSLWREGLLQWRRETIAAVAAGLGYLSGWLLAAEIGGCLRGWRGG